MSLKTFLSPPPGLCLTLSNEPTLLWTFNWIFRFSIWKADGVDTQQCLVHGREWPKLYFSQCRYLAEAKHLAKTEHFAEAEKFAKVNRLAQAKPLAKAEHYWKLSEGQMLKTFWFGQRLRHLVKCFGLWLNVSTFGEMSKPSVILWCIDWGKNTVHTAH